MGLSVMEPHVRRVLLDTAVGLVGKYGWSSAALVAAARGLNLSPAVTGILQRHEELQDVTVICVPLLL
jgi:hypothetical protein